MKRKRINRVLRLFQVKSGRIGGSMNLLGKNEAGQDLRKAKRKRGRSVYRAAFWLFAAFILGCLTGVHGANRFVIEPKLRDSVRLGGLVVQGRVYDLKERM